MVQVEGGGVMAGLKDAVVSLFRGARGAVLPGGMTVEAWQKHVEAERGAGYANAVALNLAYYRGQAASDVRAEVLRTFPSSGERMTPVQLPLLRKLVDEQAHVYGGKGEKFEIVGDDGAVIDSPAFAMMLERAEVARKLRRVVNTTTRLVRRTFVRVTWDDVDKRVRLTVFTPDVAWVRFQPDSWSLDAAHGALFALAPVIVDGKPVKRWEFWSAGETPENFIVDERGEVYGGESKGKNPYTADDGASIVPVVAFGDEDEDAGYWMPPREDWLSTQKSVNANETSRLHLARITGYGVWVAQSQSPNADPWPAEMGLSADEVFKAPNGWTLDNKFAQSDLSGLAAADDRHLRTITSLNNLPPGSVLAENRAVPSGVALAIERAPLDEVRESQVELYRAATNRLLDVMRIVHNAHADEQIPAGRGRWTPGSVRPPVDPEAQNRDDEAQIRMGIASPVTVVMRRDGVGEAEAEAWVAKVRKHNRPTATLSSLGARLVAGSPLAQAREQVAADDDMDDEADDDAQG